MLFNVRGIAEGHRGTVKGGRPLFGPAHCSLLLLVNFQNQQTYLLGMKDLLIFLPLFLDGCDALRLIWQIRGLFETCLINILFRKSNCWFTYMCLKILCVCEFSTWKLLYHDRTLKSLAKSFTIMGMNHKKPYTFFSVVLGTLGTYVEQTRISGFYRKGAQFYGIDHSSYSNVR